MAKVSMTIIPTCDPTADLSLVGAFSDAPTRVIGKLNAESGPLLVGGSVEKNSAAQFEECAVSGYSLRQTCEEDTNCPSEKPAGPFLCTHAFSPIRGGPRSVAQRDAYASLFCPYFTLKGPGGPAIRFNLGGHQPTYGGHRISGLSTARGLRNLLDIRGLEKEEQGLSSLP